MRARFPILIACSAFAAACSLPEPRASFEARDPTARSLAALDAAAEKDERSIPALIAMLDSGDPALRLIAAESLERITGETLGYDASAPEHEREEAAERWEAWWRDRRSSAPRADAGGELD